ncbi:MAG TPA: bifunctional diguanylate cyclase/phosphodiesterase [Motilibacteraceae bacterium]|nr:bifunctional diguanylate cyclase/phosphodiesterase [Motilibacteraceae bacterium]
MSHVRRGTRAVAAPVLAGVPLALAALALVLAGTLASYAVRALTALVVLGLLLAPGRRDRVAPPAARRLLAAAVGAGVVSGLAALAVASVTGEQVGVTSPGELVYLLYAPLAVAGLLAVPRTWSRLGAARVLADAAVAAGALAFLADALLVGPMGPAVPLDRTEQAVTLAYALLPAVVLAVALSLLTQVCPPARRFVGLTAAGMSLLGVADLAFCLAEWRASGSQGYVASSWMGMVHELALLVLVLAAAEGSRPLPDAHPREADQPPGVLDGLPGWWEPVVPYLPVVLGLSATAWQLVQGRAFSRLEVACTVVIAIGVVVRQVTAARDSATMLRALAERERSAQHRLRTDDLTGLPNRLALAERLDELAPDGEDLALAVLDVVGFRTLNDNHGHTAGDELLRVLGHRLAAVVPPGMLAARIGVDEFAVLAPRDQAQQLVERAVRELSRPVPLRTGTWTSRVAAGVTVTGGREVQGLLVEADLAVQHAKAQSRRGEPALHVLEPASRARGTRTALLREAVATSPVEQFHLVYQPVVALGEHAGPSDAGRLVVTGVEALLRWEHPELGAVSPAEFVPLAEQTGTIGRLTDHVLTLAARDRAGWQRLGVTDRVRVAVNVAATDTVDPALPERVCDVLRGHGLPATALTLEVTELGLLEDFDAAAQNLAMLQALGVHVAVDDFGTGYSSLRYLRRFCPDVLKIDREFVQAAAYEPTSRLLVGKVGEIASGMGMRCVAEGVETMVEVATVRHLGIEAAQGYYFSRPVPAAVVIPLLLHGVPAAPQGFVPRPSAPAEAPQPVAADVADGL